VLTPSLVPPVLSGRSYLWSVLFLMPLLAFIGPVGVGKHAVQSHGVGHEGGIMYAEKL
jgi:hypothetical protein